MTFSNPIIELKNVSKTFKKSDHLDMLVLDNISFTMQEGEIVALLGKSGSGKSTLLRIIAGLVKPSSGEVIYRNKPVQGPMSGISMVFQSFALLPWLTVLQNVELGLEALGIPREERRQRAIQAIDTVGLDGFESAFPKELSGGMRQRVGFARAIVVNPDLMLMDEPFSALDVLTADNLRSDLLDLWEEEKTNTKGILIVTHNIAEAVMLADRILVFSSDPGTIRKELAVDMPHPRDEDDPKFRRLVDDIYRLMTTRADSGADLLNKGSKIKTIGLDFRLPEVDISELTGLIEEIASYTDTHSVDLPELTKDLHLNIDDLLALTDLLEILRFADVSQGDISLTPLGTQFAIADILERKRIFGTQLVKHVPLARHIRSVLDERPTHRASEARFLTELEDYFSEKEAERVLQVVIDWGRYAELFAYNFNSESLSLDNPD